MSELADKIALLVIDDDPTFSNVDPEHNAQAAAALAINLGAVMANMLIDRHVFEAGMASITNIIRENAERVYLLALEKRAQKGMK
jgi:hypothetical protein